jgi:uncharacterized membrane protein YfcA
VETHILFFVAAVLAAAINSLAGGGLITFPLRALVEPPVVADATSALALLPAYPAAVWRTRGELTAVPRRWVWLLLIPSVLGGLVGALLLVWTGDRNFVFMVPWLVLGAVGGLVGGYLGGMVSGMVNRTDLRAVFLVIGFGLAAYYFWTLYGPPELRVGGE